MAARHRYRTGGQGVRLRFPELFDELGITALELARRSGGRIGESTAYKWQKLRGRVARIDCETVEDLCEALGVGLADVLELERRRKRA
jgi:DNA-binding Xre family transcriptional regulator